jgi:tRNA (guanine37-N1)-methyltransferase
MQLNEQLDGIIPADFLCYLSGHFDIIGDVAIIAIPPELDTYRPAIACAIRSGRRNIETVLCRVTGSAGQARTAGYEILSGGRTVTIHREFGFIYHLDVMTVFFNPRLATERRRVAEQVQPGEYVLVPFCGVGPFAIPAATRGAIVTALEQNPEACRWVTENIRSNGVADRVIVIEGDAFDRSIYPDRLFDRAIIPTPYGRDGILDLIAPMVRPDGIIHFYTFRNQRQSEQIVREFGRKGLPVVLLRRCGNVAPSVSRWAFDLRKEGDRSEKNKPPLVFHL